jgi:hypothetical protein
MQQRRTRGDHKHKAFLTTSFICRIQGVRLVQKSDDLELPLTGQLFVQGGSPTLELMDFAIPNFDLKHGLSVPESTTRGALAKSSAVTLR